MTSWKKILKGDIHPDLFGFFTDVTSFEKKCLDFIKELLVKKQEISAENLYLISKDKEVLVWYMETLNQLEKKI